MISIVIVNFNLSAEILRCLESLEQHPQSTAFEIIVVDNCSSDGSLQMLTRHLATQADHQLISMASNVGFGAACNAGAQAATGDVLCFLNPDTTAESDFLGPLKSALDQTGATLAGPGYHDTGRFEFSAGWFPSIALELLNVFLVGRHIEAWLMARRRKRQADQPFIVDWVVGACMLINRQRFEAVGGFDPAFFLFFEELDLCKRIQEQGGSVVFVPTCRIQHIGSVSGRRDYVLFTRRFYEGKTRFIAKHHSGLSRQLLFAFLWLQMRSQQILWLLLWYSNPKKAKQKLQGFNQAIRILSQFRTGLSEQN